MMYTCAPHGAVSHSSRRRLVKRGKKTLAVDLPRANAGGR
jgi:hypothetical protein